MRELREAHDDAPRLDNNDLDRRGTQSTRITESRVGERESTQRGHTGSEAHHDTYQHVGDGACVPSRKVLVEHVSVKKNLLHIRDLAHVPFTDVLIERLGPEEHLLRRPGAGADTHSVLGLRLRACARISL